MKVKSGTEEAKNTRVKTRDGARARPEKTLTVFLTIAGSLVGFYWTRASLSLLTSLAEYCPSPADGPLIASLGLSVDDILTVF